MPHPVSLLTVLQAVATSPTPVSRADVAAACGLTKATVSTHVERLVASRLVREGDAVPRSGAGRPATGLTLDGDRVAAVGLEIGVDYLAGCVRDLAGVVRQRALIRGTDRRRPAVDVLRTAADVAAALVRIAEADGLTVVGIGVAVPGLVDTDRGTVLLAPNLGWQDVDVATPVRVAAGVPVVVDNEATLGTLAETGYPTTRSVSGVDPSGGYLVVSGEVGIGAGLVQDGRLVRGRHGWGGELGHVTVDPAGDLCGCGARGCLEVVAGQEAILRAAGRDPFPTTALGGPVLGGLRLDPGLDDVELPEPPPTAVHELVAAADAGDGLVLEALSRAGTALGVALSSAVNVLDVDAVVLAGIYAELSPWLVPVVERELSVRALRSRLLPVRVAVSRTGPDAAVLGAAALLLRAVLAAPDRWLVSP